MDGAHVIAGLVLPDVVHFAVVAALAVLHLAIAAGRADRCAGQLGLHLHAVGMDDRLHRGKRLHRHIEQPQQALHVRALAADGDAAAVGGVQRQLIGVLPRRDGQKQALVLGGGKHRVVALTLQRDAAGHKQRTVRLYRNGYGQWLAVLPAGAHHDLHVQQACVMAQQQIHRDNQHQL